MTLIELVLTPVLGSGVTDPPDISLGVSKSIGQLVPWERPGTQNGCGMWSECMETA